jgi:putative transposase
LLEFAKLPRSTFYYHLALLALADKDAVLKRRLAAIFKRHKGNYGYRRITAALNYGREKKVNNKKVYRLLGEMQMRSTQRPKKYKSYKGDVGKAAGNVLNRQFQAETPNTKWVTDVTEFKCVGEKLYLSPILDLYNGEIIAFEMHSRPKYELVGKMIKKAFAKLAPADRPLLHSDQGWHYRMKEYRDALATQGMEQSMSRKANCHDNAVMENFFGILKSEMFYKQKFATIKELRNAITAYIRYYNHHRIKARLGWLSPVQFRTQPALKLV